MAVDGYTSFASVVTTMANRSTAPIPKAIVRWGCIPPITIAVIRDLFSELYVKEKEELCHIIIPVPILDSLVGMRG